MRVGYARCANRRAAIRAETAALRERGCERIFIDRGVSTAHPDRPELAAALATCQPAGLLVVTRLSCLAVSFPDALALLTQLSSLKVPLEVGGHEFVWTRPHGEGFLQAAGLFTELYADLVRGRITENVAIAEQGGRRIGRPTRLDDQGRAELWARWKTGTRTYGELAEEFGISSRTVSREIQQMIAKEGSPE
jgi:DNA invertase Pin-like site-specific DNA recombinase